jgi:hypothetical protein
LQSTKPEGKENIMKKNTWLAIAVVSMAITSLFVGTAFSAELDLTLSQKTDISRTNHIAAGAGSDQGVIYAASPALKGVIGFPVTIGGETLRITY